MERFVENLRSVNLFPTILVKIYKAWMNMVVQTTKFSSLLRKEEAFRGSVLNNFFETNQDFIEPKGKQTCMEIGLCI